MSNQQKTWLGRKIDETPILISAVLIVGIIFLNFVVLPEVFPKIFDAKNYCQNQGKIHLSWDGSCVTQSKFDSVENKVVNVLKDKDDVKVGFIQARTPYSSDTILGVSEKSRKYGCYGVQTGFMSAYYKCALQK